MKCLCCGKDNNLVLVGKNEYYYCPHCFFLQKKVEIWPCKEDEKARYLHHIVDSAYYSYMEGLFRVLKPYIVGKRILDFGCGHENVLSKIMINNNYDVVSYDKFFYPKMYEGLFDTIILIEVIEHIANPLDVLRNLKDSLNNNGRIIIQTNLIPDNFTNWWYLRDITHISFFKKKTFEIIAKILNMQLLYEKEGNLIILKSYN